MSRGDLPDAHIAKEIGEYGVLDRIKLRSLLSEDDVLNTFDEC
jgi:hypothetical protein